jgi:hypothetical protein
MRARTLTSTAYLFMAAQGYLLYGVGFITPYLQADLGVPPWAAALPNSMMAVGILSGGLCAQGISRRIGPRSAVRMWAGLMALAAALMAIHVTILPTLVGALLLGASIAGMLVHVVSALGGQGGGRPLTRAYLWAMVAATAAPVVLSAAARSVGWGIGVLVPIPFLLLLAVTLPATPARDVAPGAGAREPRLPGPYWRIWAFLVLCMGAEFSIVAWGAQVATARTGMAAADATGLAALYVAGMVVGRLALSAGLPIGPANRPLLSVAAGVVLAGSAVLWVAPTVALAGAGLLLTGLGMSGIMPLGSTLALAQAPDAPIRASTRLSAAMGVAVLVAPLVVGLASGSVGVLGAWLLVFALLVGALLVLWRVPALPPAATR